MHLLIPTRETTTDESTDTTKVKVDEPVSFMGVTYRRNMGEGLFTGAKMTQKNSCITKAYPITAESSQKVGTWSTTAWPVDCSTGW